MAKLHQVLALVSGIKSRCQKTVTEFHHKLQKAELLSGISRTYQPKDEEGEKLPSEKKLVQIRVNEAINEVSSALAELLDTVATQDNTNCEARANIVVDGKVLATNVPVTNLMFLDKQLQDLHTFIAKLPILDPAQEWEFSNQVNCYASKPIQTVRTKKVPRTFVKYEATKEHPAQVDVFTEDVVVGYYNKVDFSGAVPEKDRNEMLKRVEALQDAVKKAREEANARDVVPLKVGRNLLDYVFNGKTV